MEQKESKSLKHFYFSLTKSFIRIGACLLLIANYPTYFAAGMILAEVLGILEEF